jgi:excisionase family DNA binding protein
MIEGELTMPAEFEVRNLTRAVRKRRTSSAGWESNAMRRLAVTVDEAAEMLGVGRATLYKLVMRGEIESFTVGRARRIAISALEQYAHVKRSA